MSGKLLWGSWLLAAWAFVPAPGFGQRLQEIQSESLDPGTNSATEPKNGPDLARVKDLIVVQTNQFRAQQGRGPLKVNPQLAAAAQSFAEYMARTDKFSHTADGKEPWERTAEAGYKHCIILENIAYDYNSAGFTTEDLASALMRMWKESPGHRKNLLDPDVQEIGVGVARSSRTGRYYAVQDFGRPRSAAVTFKVTNQTDSPVKYTVDGRPYTADAGYTITHETCRPPELRFQWPPDATVTPAAQKPFRPQQGSHYVVRKREGGAYDVNIQ